MSELKPVFSPIFPTEQPIDVSEDATPLAQTGSIRLFIQLAEPVVFLQGFEPTAWEGKPPSMLRGSLIVRVLKPSKIKKITLNLRGYTRTEWPEGIPPKKDEYVEINDVVNHTWPFYHSVDNKKGKPTLKSKDPNGYLLRESCASMYKAPSTSSKHHHHHNHNQSPARSTKNTPLSPNSNDLISTFSLSASPTTRGFDKILEDNDKIDALSLNSISPMSSPKMNPINDSNPKVHSPPIAKSSFISDLFGVGGGTGATSPGPGLINTSDVFIFEPGDYIYTFEQPIPQSYPESLRSHFGFVNYQLLATVERYGVFKSNITAKHNVKLVRMPSTDSVEETEPIAISKDWKDQLHYDIVVASKDIVLDAFLPIAFQLTPLDKVTLHRIRIYLTESMEYYCRHKQVHRMEPTRKFLLAEHNGPILDSMPPNMKTPKAKYLGNLLVDPTNGDLVNKNFEYQVFIPSKLENGERLHPDTGFENIQSNHWINLCLRLSQVIDGVRRHFEVNIDSPIHVLNKLCSHANTLLPSYATNDVADKMDLTRASSDRTINFGNVNNEDVNLYHNSNIFFPKDIILSPMLSPNVQTMDVKFPIPSGFLSPRHGPQDNPNNNKLTVLNSPKLKANIYKPANLNRELTYSQAMPLSPISSPRMKHMTDSSNDEVPPPFTSVTPTRSTHTLSDPPTYAEATSTSNNNNNNSNETTASSNSSMTIPEFELNRSLVPSNSDSVSGSMRRIPTVARDYSNQSVPSNNENTQEDNEDADMASGYQFDSNPRLHSNRKSVSSQGPILNSLRNGIPNTETYAKRRNNSLPMALPSTVRNNNQMFSDLSQVLSGDSANTQLESMSSQHSSIIGRSPRSSLDSTTNQILSRDPAYMEPLLHSETRQDHSMDEGGYQSLDSVTNLAEQPTDTSVDITALYDPNSVAWHPLQNLSDGPILSPPGSPRYTASLNTNSQIIDDFKETFHSSI
ncbi:hypothetical protein NCAS_0B07690 [Naumovozyma castellii]|uniref:Arrestin C-terminal-like domain-containing protein n=1 Tax=Naumovozyma castellii TaxID=27288 RepID=G0VAC3_NAUCA|nr:hypothetical protein NCAS_0B07690 [Naumovozyma castellii CBS 4309]CCC68853.1 hypothetical protein NCAS_0B07690 [Naumovozyma castellii CBS 4309]